MCLYKKTLAKIESIEAWKIFRVGADGLYSAFNPWLSNGNYVSKSYVQGENVCHTEPGFYSFMLCDDAYEVMFNFGGHWALHDKLLVLPVTAIDVNHIGYIENPIGARQYSCFISRKVVLKNVEVETDRSKDYESQVKRRLQARFTDLRGRSCETLDY